ncbi:MAG: hypothetical protein J6U04_07635 [Salinivirgaceae bacterium]|nr:hypothetical protein [Salinivirgaceae bacterium]
MFKKVISRPVNKILIALLSVVLGVAVFFFVRYRDYLEFGSEVDMSIVQMWNVYGAPTAESNWMFGMILAAEHGDWNKVAKLTERDRHSVIGTYYHNLAMAKQGRLSAELMNYYQPLDAGLFMPIKQGSRPLFVSCAGEVWYQLGGVIMAEHSTMLGLAFTASQSGKRFYRRLAQIAHINGDTCAIRKYERLLGAPVDDDWKEKLPFTSKSDIVVFPGQNRLLLHNLLESNPDNIMAYEYLLCYDLLRKDIGSFIEDYQPGKVKSKLYDEALIVYLAGDGLLSDAMIAKYGINRSIVANFRAYSNAYMMTNADKRKMKEKYGNTYWYYFNFVGKDD